MKNYTPSIITENFIADYFQISNKEARNVYKSLELVVYDNNDVIVRKGDDADGLYFIDEGKATVINEDGEIINELEAGQYFGEYAILSGEKRLSTVLSHGKTTVFRLTSKAFLDIVAVHPQITGRLLKQVYGQITNKHTKLVSLTHKSRGITWSPNSISDLKPRDIFITYGAVFLVFAVTIVLAVLGVPNTVLWKLLPVVFFIAFTLRTRRMVEGMILTLMLLEAMLNNGNFIVGFGNMLVEGIGNTDTATTIAIMTMVECVAALLTSAGVVIAFKKVAQRFIKSRTGSMIGMLFILIAVCIDECLNVITAGFCLNEISDKQKVPRESRALMASFSTAICAMIPFSLWGAYVNGWLATYSKNSSHLFLNSILFNIVGWVVILFAILLCFGILPRTKQIKEAYYRVLKGGTPWPTGSEKYFDDDEDINTVGSLRNLFLPMIVWAVSSILCGMYIEGADFTLGALYGLIITLVFMFILYVGQKKMSPKFFFENLTDGIENAVMPILLYVFAEQISLCLEDLGFINLFLNSIVWLVRDNIFLIPSILFIISTLLCMSLGSCWGMYGIGIPVTMYLTSSLSINPAICIGAVLAAGLVGEALCPYVDESSPAVSSIGCNPEAYRKIRISYWIPIGIISIVGYLLIGFIFLR